MDSALHRANKNATEELKAEVPGAVKSMYRPAQTSVIRIALTGGPCGGKSSALEALREEANAKQGTQSHLPLLCMSLSTECVFGCDHTLSGL